MGGGVAVCGGVVGEGGGLSGLQIGKKEKKKKCGSYIPP